MSHSGPFDAGNLYFKSRAKFREAKFHEIFFHKTVHVSYCRVEFRKWTVYIRNFLAILKGHFEIKILTVTGASVLRSIEMSCILYVLVAV